MKQKSNLIKLFSIFMIFIMVFSNTNVITFAETNNNKAANVIVDFNEGLYNNNGVGTNKLEYSVPIGETITLFNKNNISYSDYEYSGYKLSINNQNGDINAISSDEDGNINFTASDDYTYTISINYDEVTVNTRDYAEVNIYLNNGIYYENDKATDKEVLTYQVPVSEKQKLLNLSSIKRDNYTMSKIEQSATEDGGLGVISLDEDYESLDTSNLYFNAKDNSTYHIYIYWKESSTPEIKDYATIYVNLNGGTYVKDNTEDELTFTVNKNETKTLFNLNDIKKDGYSISKYKTSCTKTSEIGGSITVDENNNVICNNIDAISYEFTIEWEEDVNNVTREYATVSVDFNGGVYTKNNVSYNTLNFEILPNETKTLFNLNDVKKEGYYISDIQITKKGNSIISTNETTSKDVIIENVDNGSYNIILNWTKTETEIVPERTFSNVKVNFNDGIYNGNKDLTCLDYEVSLNKTIEVLDFSLLKKEGYDVSGYNFTFPQNVSNDCVVEKDNKLYFTNNLIGDYTIDILWKETSSGSTEPSVENTVKIITNDDENQIITIGLSDKIGSTLNLLDISSLTKENYEFIGYSISTSGKSTISLENNILKMSNIDDKDYVITLKWEEVEKPKTTSTLTLELNGGTYKGKTSYVTEVEVGKDIIFIVNDFKKDNYTFNGVTFKGINNEVVMSSDYKTFTYKVKDNTASTISINWKEVQNVNDGEEDEKIEVEDDTEVEPEKEIGMVTIKFNNKEKDKIIYLDKYNEKNAKILDLNKVKKAGYMIDGYKVITYDGKATFSLKDDRYIMINNPDNGTYEIKLLWEKIKYQEKTTITIGKGEKYKHTLPDVMSGKIKYKISNKKIVSVDKNGKIKGLKPGKTKITITDSNGLKQVLTVNVKKAPTKITMKGKTIKKGKTITLKPSFKKNEFSNKITWSSSNKKIATVNSKGVVKANKKGTCYITAKTFNGKKVKVKIKVK